MMNAQLSQAPQRKNPTGGQAGRAENQKHYMADYSTTTNKCDIAHKHIGMFNAYDIGKTEVEHLNDAVKRYCKNKLFASAMVKRYDEEIARAEKTRSQWLRMEQESTELLQLVLSRFNVAEGNRHV